MEALYFAVKWDEKKNEQHKLISKLLNRGYLSVGLLANALLAVCVAQNEYYPSGK